MVDGEISDLLSSIYKTSEDFRPVHDKFYVDVFYDYGVSYFKVVDDKAREKMIEALREMAEIQTRLQILLNALLSVLVRHYKSDEIIYGIRSGMHGALLDIEALKMTMHGKKDCELLAHLLDKFKKVLMDHAWKLYKGVQEKLDLHDAVMSIAYTMNINRYLLNITLALLDYISRNQRLNLESINKVILEHT